MRVPRTGYASLPREQAGRGDRPATLRTTGQSLDRHRGGEAIPEKRNSCAKLFIFLVPGKWGAKGCREKVAEEVDKGQM